MFFGGGKKGKNRSENMKNYAFVQIAQKKPHSNLIFWMRFFSFLRIYLTYVNVSSKNKPHLSPGLNVVYHSLTLKSITM